MMNEAKEEFEKWVKEEENFWDLSLELDESGLLYKDNNTHHRWCGFARAWIHLWFKLKEEEKC